MTHSKKMILDATLGIMAKHGSIDVENAVDKAINLLNLIDSKISNSTPDDKEYLRKWLSENIIESKGVFVRTMAIVDAFPGDASPALIYSELRKMLDESGMNYYFVKSKGREPNFWQGISIKNTLQE